MKTKFILFLVAVLSFNTAAFSCKAFADLSASFYIQPGSYNVTEGESFTVFTTGKNIQNMYACEVILTYDDNLLEFVSGASDISGQRMIFHKDGDNKIIFVIAKKTEENGDLALCKLTFTGKAKGKAQVTLSRVKILDEVLKSTDYSVGKTSEISILPTVSSPSPSPTPLEPPAQSITPTPSGEPTQTVSPTPAPAQLPSDIDKGETVGSSAIVKGLLDPETGKYTAKVGADTFAALVAKAIGDEAAGQNPVLEIKVESSEDAKMVEVEVPADAFKQAADTANAGVKMDTGIGSITFNNKAVASISASALQGDVSISIQKVEKEGLTEEVKEKVGDRPVYDFSVRKGSTRVSDFGGGQAEVVIPYTPQEGENVNSIVVYYIDDTGELTTVRGRYDAAAGAVKFTASHFSIYAVGYNEVKFIDVTANDWYNEAVGFIAARGITKGVGGGMFKPGDKVRRADFLIMVMEAYGIALDTDISDNFTDAGDNYYTKYLGTAKRLGLVLGVGDNKFLPELTISRQDMLVILYRMLEQLGELPAEGGNSTLEDFTDTNEIADYAQEALNRFVGAGIVRGNGKRLAPRATAERAEIAQLLYNLLSK